jgi:hypothetical protein
MDWRASRLMHRELPQGEVVSSNESHAVQLDRPFDREVDPRSHSAQISACPVGDSISSTSPLQSPSIVTLVKKST